MVFSSSHSSNKDGVGKGLLASMPLATNFDSKLVGIVDKI